MAEDINLAEKTFNEAEASFADVETSYNAAQEALKQDESNEELKTAFAEQEKLFKTATETRDAAKSALDEPKESAKKGYWPEDWRERYVEKQTDKDGNPLDEAAKDKLMKRLSRYDSPRAVTDAMINAQNKISSGSLVKIPGKDATDEELAEYRKEVGIPETPKEYDLNLGDGLVIGDDDKEFVNEFLEAAHGSNYTQQQVTDGLNWYYKNQENLIAERHALDAKHQADVAEDLRNEWGTEYRANLNLLKNYLSTDFAEGVSELFEGARLADGTPLGDHPDILRGFVAKARAENPMGAMVPGSGTKQHEQMISDIESLEKKMGTDGALKGKDQDRYLKLISLRDGIPEK